LLRDEVADFVAVRRWNVVFESAARQRTPAPPRPADINSLGRGLLGEHSPHDDPIKPRSLHLRVPLRGRLLAADLRWLADKVDPVLDPEAAMGTVLRCGEHVLTVVAVDESDATSRADLLDRHAEDPLLEVDVQALTPILLPSAREAPPATLDSRELARSLVDRWNDYCRWRPGQRLVEAADQVPSDVLSELLDCLVITRVSKPGMAPQQVKYDAGRVIEKPAWQADLRLRWHPCSEVTAVWASGLCELMGWDGLGLQTQAGLGQVAVTPVLRAHDLD
jgi:hypothetical protein